jgi:hypothetical protein
MMVRSAVESGEEGLEKRDFKQESTTFERRDSKHEMVNLVLCEIKAYVGAEVYLHSILTSALDGGEWSVSKDRLIGSYYLTLCEIKAYEGAEVYLHSFLTSALDRGEWSVSRDRLIGSYYLTESLRWMVATSILAATIRSLY